MRNTSQVNLFKHFSLLENIYCTLISFCESFENHWHKASLKYTPFEKFKF